MIKIYKKKNLKYKDKLVIINIYGLLAQKSKLY